MTQYFQVLSDAEYQKLKDAISLITIYIAGADGHIDTKEIQWAEKLNRIRAFNLPDGLQEFYKDVGIDFSEKINKIVQEHPDSNESRKIYIEEKLGEVNPILTKLDTKLGAQLYDSFRSFAKHVAKADGGVLGIFSIGPKEAELIELKVINPIKYEGE